MGIREIIDPLPGGAHIHYNNSTVYRMQPPITYERILKHLEKVPLSEKIKLYLKTRKWFDKKLEIIYSDPRDMKKFLANDGVDYFYSWQFFSGNTNYYYFYFTNLSINHMRIIK